MAAMRKPSRSLLQAGMSLIELLVAITILAILSVSLIETERLSLSTTGRVQQRAQALSHAASLLAEREAGARADGSGALSDGARFRIASLVRSDLVRPGAVIQPLELIVEVRMAGHPPVRLSTLSWIDTGAR